MDSPTPAHLRAKRSEAQKIAVTLHVGKNGVTDATIAELDGQLRKHKLVKVRLLPASTEGGQSNQDQAETLAAGTHSHLIEVRGHTAVYWRA